MRKRLRKKVYWRLTPRKIHIVEALRANRKLWDINALLKDIEERFRGDSERLCRQRMVYLCKGNI